MTTDNRSQIRQVLLMTLGLNLLVMMIKAIVGWMSGSLSLRFGRFTLNVARMPSLGVME